MSNRAQMETKNITLTKQLAVGAGMPSSSVTATAGQTVNVVFTVSNPNNHAIFAITLTDSLPPQLQLASSATNPICSPGSAVTTNSATQTITASIVAIAANNACMFTVPTTATAVAGAPTGTNTATAIFDGMLPVSSSATVTITATPTTTLTKAFLPPVICFGGQSLLVFKLTNTSTSAATGLSFSDPLPSNVRALVTGTQVVCGGASLTTSTNLAGSNVSLTGLSLAAGASCQFAVPVIGVTANTQTNTTSPVMSGTVTTGGAASAVITVLPTKGQLAVLSPCFCRNKRCRHG